MSGAFVLIDKALLTGKDVKQIMKDWMAHFRNLLIAKYVKTRKDLLNLSTENIELLKQQAAGIELEEINRAIITLAKAINDARYSTQARILLEVAVVSIASGMEYGEAPEVPRRSKPRRAAAGKPSLQRSLQKTRGQLQLAAAPVKAPAYCGSSSKRRRSWNPRLNQAGSKQPHLLKNSCRKQTAPAAAQAADARRQGKRPKEKRPSGGGSMAQMQQLQAMQRQMESMQAELEEKEVEASAGGGMVTAKVSGKKQLIDLTIDKDAVDPDDVETLQDMIIAAVNEGLRQIDEMQENEYGKLTGGLNTLECKRGDNRRFGEE